MLVLSKGECEHCHRNYRYDLLSAVFGEFSYAYCDTCGMLATLSYHDPRMALLPHTEKLYQEIDATWEPFVQPCPCGGHFRTGAAPRCPWCDQQLSAEIAASHIEQNSQRIKRGWQWQRNWSDTFCIAIEDPENPGAKRQVMDHFRNETQAASELHKGTTYSFNV